MNYGFHLSSEIPAERELLQEITHIERMVSNLRSTSNNWQDYIPILRILPGKNTAAVEFRERRDRYLSLLLNRLKGNIAMGTDRPCITGNILKDPEAVLNESKLGDVNQREFRLTKFEIQVRSIQSA